MQPVACWVLLTSMVASSLGGAAHRKTEVANRHYAEGRLDEALRVYTEAQEHAPDSPELLYDIGNVLYRQDDFEGAAEAYVRALLASETPLEGAAAYNLGNARYRMEQYEEAIDAYRRALRANPSDLDAKRNLELALLARQQQQQQQQQEQQQQDPGEEGEEGEEKPQRQEQDASEDGEPGEPGEQEQQQQEQTSGEEGQQGEQAAQQDPADASGEQGQSGESSEIAAGELTPEQAEQLLRGLEEQELDNLRDEVRSRRRTSAGTAEEDW